MDNNWWDNILNETEAPVDIYEVITAKSSNISLDDHQTNKDFHVKAKDSIGNQNQFDP